jgi:hypothetical protein
MGMLGGLAVLSLLALLTRSIVPQPACAYWEPPPIAKETGPGDPGTPFEEPEGDPSDEPSKPPSAIQGPTAPPGTPVDEPAAPPQAQPNPRWVFLVLQAWRIHILLLVRS